MLVPKVRQKNVAMVEISEDPSENSIHSFHAVFLMCRFRSSTLVKTASHLLDGLLHDLMVPFDVHDIFWVVVWISGRFFDPPRRRGNSIYIVRAGTGSVHFGVWCVGVEDV